MAGERTRVAALVWLTRRLEAARGCLFVWAPVLLGSGIGIYFRLPVEPSPVVFAALAALAIITNTPLPCETTVQ